MESRFFFLLGAFKERFLKRRPQRTVPVKIIPVIIYKSLFLADLLRELLQESHRS